MRFAPVVLLALLVGCSCEKEPPPKTPRPVVQEPVPVPMSQATWGRIRFRIPTAWKDHRRLAADGHQIIFDGPRDKGEPTVSLYWVESRRTLEDWAEYMRRKYDTPGGPGLVVEQGWTSLGRKRAYYMIYELARDKPMVGIEGGTHMTIDYYFQHDGHVGFLRGTSLKEYFPGEYRALFARIADLYFLPPPK